MKRHITIMAMACYTIIANAQEDTTKLGESDGAFMVSQILEEMTADDIDTEGLQEEAANLINLSEEKIDLNAATFEELGQLFFLKEYQRDNIIYQRERFGPYCSEAELLTIPGISVGDAERILAFAYIKPYKITYGDTKRNKFALLTRIQRTYPKAKGFTAKNDTTDAAFLGSPYKTLIRAKGNIHNKVSYGIVAESDAGEPTFSHGISTFDFLSGYIAVTPKERIVREVILGNYTARFGQGAGIWTGTSYDMSSIQSSVTKYGNRLKPSTSANEYDYLRGIAIELGSENIKVDGFFSHTDNDASIILDNDSSYYVTTIQTSGLHRTTTELKNRNTLQQIITGAVFTHVNNKHHISVGFNHWHSSVKIGDKGELYRKYVPHNDNIGTLHADYRYYIRKVMIYGEGVHQSTGAFAIIQGVDAELGSNTLTIAYRHFDRKYYNHNQHPFSRATHPGGETGLYLGLLMSPSANTNILANVNVYRNNWLQYLKPCPTNGYRARVNITHTINDDNTISLRLRNEKYEDSYIKNRGIVTPIQKQNFRVTWTSSPNEHLRFTSAVEATKFSQKECRSEGFWGSEQITAKLDKISCSVLLGHFDTDDYNSRIYHSLPDVASSMSIPAFSGRGIVTATNIRWSPSTHFDLWIWGCLTKYYDRTTIGTSYNEIESSRKVDAKIQLRVKL